MKKATPKSSPNYRSSKYSKSKTGYKSKPNKPEANACIINQFDEQVLLLALQTGTALDQHNIIICPAGHEHEIDISPFIEKLRKAGYAIDEHTQMWKGNCPYLGKGKAINLTRVYSYIGPTRSAAND
jgi:hypothetical protein|tara:strand:- start:319 stop:699 length:381 start_codon:yes stop_codon:yes gene_type:complete